MKKLSILLLCIPLFFLGCQAIETPGTIYGKVYLTDKSDYSGVLITIDNTTLSTVSDKTGAYAITNIPPGNYTVSANKDSYMSSSPKKVAISLNQSIKDINFILVSSQPPALPED
jgi:hypothetical protein